MRGSGWLLPAGAALLWLIAVAWPAVAATLALATEPATGGDAFVAIRPLPRLLLDTAAYASIVTVGAVLLGWAPGRWLGRSLGGRGFGPLACLMVFPICMPAYVVFYLWWETWPPNSPVHAWAVARDLLPFLRQATLVVALVCWSWPIVAWCVAGEVARTPAARDDLLRVDGAGPGRRLADLFRRDGRGLALGGLVVFLIAFNNTTCFDLAQIFSFGNELRAKSALGATTAGVLVASLPAVGLAGAGAVAVWIGLGRGRERRAPIGAPRRPARVTVALAVLIWIVSALAPLLMLARRIVSWEQIVEFAGLYGPAVGNAAATAGATAFLGACIAVGLAIVWLDHRPWVRRFGDVQAVGWLVAALVPALVAGVALEAAYNRSQGVGGLALATTVYGQPWILLVAQLGRAAFVAALLARWIVAREPRGLADLRRIDGAGGLLATLVAGRPAFVAAGVAGFAVTGVLAAMHYQRPETVVMAVLLLMVIAAGVALVTTTVWAGLARHARTLASMTIVLSVALALPGCGGDPTEPEPLSTRRVFGSSGTAMGQFSYPRGIAIDHEREVLYIVDKTARVQRFGFDGKPQLQWRMPEFENGKPTGLSVAPDGTVFVADTHYYRVIAYDPEGNEIFRFGQYGEGPGEFIYTTDIAFGPDDRLYVGEYGGHDRIQVFDAGGGYLFEFGSFGSEDGQFDRPQAIVFGPDRRELFIADACNHRIVVVDPDGNWLRSFGGPGAAPGQLHYPYGLTIMPDGLLYVTEFGNARIQRFTRDGQPRGVFGRLGAGDGELKDPWAMAGTSKEMFVLDSRNNRVQVSRVP